MKQVIANTVNRSLWDTIFDMCDEMDDIELFELGMNEIDINEFFEMGLTAYSKNDMVFVMNDLSLLAVYALEEFKDLIARGELVQSYTLDECITLDREQLIKVS